ncbi:MAG: hypothetical protein EA372_01805 [Chromatiaceae bacterium]|nr:MAG: hypothetical protein EA372_01805 [Chromatiaceae bacterium]
MFRDQIARPFVLVASGAEKFVARQRRAAARIGRRVPAIVGERASHWRLGQTAVAALIVAVLIIEANGWK